MRGTVEWSSCDAASGWWLGVQAWANRRGEVAVSGVGTVDVVVEAPVLDDHSGFEERVELPAVEQLVASAAVEGLDPGVLPR
jgi:hypothetical protein